MAFAVVIALQAVGVVLVSAMLITPAAAAYLLTDRLSRMLWLSAVFGLVAGALGAFFSFLGPNLPTGPFMVLARQRALRWSVRGRSPPRSGGALVAASLTRRAHAT